MSTSRCSRSRVRAAIVTLSAATGLLVLGLLGGSAARVPNEQPTGHVIYYFDEPRDLSLDVEALALLDETGELGVGQMQALLADWGIDFIDENRIPIAGWSVATTPAGQRTPAQIEQLVFELANAQVADFISPVFFDDFGGPLVVTPDILVGFHDNVRAGRAEDILWASGAGVITDFDYANMPGVYRLRSTSRNGFDVLEAANALARLPEVMFAEPDMIFTGRHDVIPNDPLFPDTWGVHNTAQTTTCGAAGTADIDMDGPEAWDFNDGKTSIRVVIIDSGYQLNHPDLNHSGFGADFTGEGGAGAPVHPCDQHGTAVAGCVSGIMNNNLGGVGIAPGCAVASARPFIPSPTGPLGSCTGNWTSQASWTADAVNWALNTVAARVTNNSNSYGFTSGAIATAYTNTRNAGLVHFASAGNDSSTTINYPASLSSVNAVTAIDSSGNLAGFSTTGVGLAFSGPGVEVMTTDRTGGNGYIAGDYVCVQGTSFASPYSAGVAGLVLSVNASFTAAQVETIMQQSATDLGAGGYDTTFGWGLVNAHQAILGALGSVCGPSAGSCYTANGSAGCSNAACCTTVCELDPFCCQSTWDSLCVSEAFDFCGNCGSPAAGDCFSSNGTPGCDDDACCQIVCEDDPFCCNSIWDSLCADGAALLCTPPNDACASAIPVSTGQSVNGNLTNASNDGSANCGASSTNPDVWYSFTAPSAGTLFANTCGTHDAPGVDLGMDTVLSVHSACPGTTGNELDCDDDWPFGSDPTACTGLDTSVLRDSAVAVPMTTGQTVFIRVSHFGGAIADGQFVLNISYSKTPPPNDECVGAVPIFNGATGYDMTGATFDTTDCFGPGFPSIYYDYTANFTGDLTINACDDVNFNGIEVYDGCGCPTNIGSQLACDGGVTACSPNGSSSEVTIPVVNGGCYKIRLTTVLISTGTITITKAPVGGACCLWDGSCVDVNTQVDCDALGGTYQGDGTDCANTNCPPPPQGANFFFDQGLFAEALAAAGKVSKVAWDFAPNNVPAGAIWGLDDPVNINGHTGSLGDPWAPPAFWPPDVDNVTFQSNMGPHPQPPDPNPAGLDGLAIANAFPPFNNNILVANTFLDSFDIISGPPAGDNHTAMSLELVTALGAGPIFVTVYDKNEMPRAKIKVDVANGQKVFLGILVNGAFTIGRVNLWDLSGGAEGISAFTLYLPAPPSCPEDLDGDGDVDSADLTILLGAWAAGTAGGDIDGDGDTDSADLTLLLGAWAAGGCPPATACANPGTCASGYPVCGPGGTCICMLTFGGGGACVDPSTSCTGLAPCPAGTCPPGEVCIETCCAQGPFVCIPESALCIGPAESVPPPPGTMTISGVVNGNPLTTGKN